MVYGHIFTNTYIHIHARTLNLINTSTQLYSYKHLQKVDPPDYSYDCAYMYADIRFILGFFEPWFILGFTKEEPCNNRICARQDIYFSTMAFFAAYHESLWPYALFFNEAADYMHRTFLQPVIFNVLFQMYKAFQKKIYPAMYFYTKL